MLTWKPQRLLLPAIISTNFRPQALTKPTAAVTSGHQHLNSGRRSRRRAQQPLSAATTSSSTPSLEACSLQQGVSAEEECILLGSASGSGSTTQPQQQQPQQQQQQHELHHHELQNNECNGMCRSEEQSTSNLQLQELSVNSMTLPSSMHSQANRRDATPKGARLQDMANLMTPTEPRSRLHRPSHRPDPLPPDSSMQLQTVPRTDPGQQQPPFILFPPPESSGGSNRSSNLDPSPDGSHFPLQPPLQPQLSSRHAPTRKPSAVLGARWGKWVLHMRPWYAHVRPWWCRKAKRRRRPKPNRFRMTVSRTSDLDILQEFHQFKQQHLEQLHQHQQQHQQQHETQPHSAQAILNSSRHSSSGSSSNSNSQLGQLVTTLVMQPRHATSKPALSAIHTLGGALSNNNKPWAHYTLDGGAHWRSMPFSNVRTAQGALLLAAQLDCSPRRQSSSSSSNSSSKHGATVQASTTHGLNSVVSCSSAAQSAPAEGAPASTPLQVIVTASPHPPSHSTGSPRKWRHHLLQLQPGACYMLEDAAAARKRTQSAKGASYPLSIAQDPLMHPLVNGSSAGPPAPPPYPLLPPSAQYSQSSLHTTQHQHRQPQEQHLQQQQQQQPLPQQQQQQQQQQRQQPLFHRLLQQPVVLVTSVHMVAGRQRCPEDDAGARSFCTAWRHSNLLHPSLLVYTTHRCWRSYQQLWKDKQHVLEAPDVLILANGTRIMYQVAGGGWQEDTQWRAVLDDRWDRGRVVQAAEAVATAMNNSPQQHAQQPQYQQNQLPHHVDLRGPHRQHQLHMLQHPGSLQGVELHSRGAAAGEEQPQQQHPHHHLHHQQHQQGVAKSVTQPQTLVRADVVKEQNSHRVRMLVRVHAADALLAALQQELEGARARQQEELLVQHLQQAEHLPLVHFLRPDTQHLSSQSGAAHPTSPSSACSLRGEPWLAPSSPMLMRMHQHDPHQQHLQQKQESLQHLQLSQLPLSTSSSSSSSSSSEGLGCALSRPSQQQQHQHQLHQRCPMAWSLVLQPPQVIGQGRGWAAVDVIPHSAGVGPAVAHVLARFGINAAPAPQQQQQQQQGPGGVPVVACTNSVQDQESLRQVSTLRISHVPQAKGRRGNNGSGGFAKGHGGHQTDVESHSWGAVGVLEGLSKLGLS